MPCLDDECCQYSRQMVRSTSIEDFLDEGAAGVITKPFELQHFTTAIQKALSA